MRLIHTATANGRTAIGDTPEAATRELEKLTPIHDVSVAHAEMFFGRPELEVLHVHRRS